MVVNEEETDRDDFELISTEHYFTSQGEVTPDHPEISVELKAVNTYEYVQRIKTERFVQQYRPRLGYVLAGAAGAGLSYYAAFSDKLIKTPSDPQKYALTATGSTLLMLSLINMEPVGEAVKTGESRLLRKTGIKTEVDTTDAQLERTETALLRLTYQNETLLEEQRPFTGNSIEVNLVEELNAENLDPNADDPLIVHTRYNELEHIEQIPVTSVFEKFAVVSSEITALRNSPKINPNNILTDLGRGSQLKLVSEEGEWSKVMYGIAEHWVRNSDVYTILRPSEFASDLSVITVSKIPFGAVDVERNIPQNPAISFSKVGFVLANRTYSGALSERIYAERDSRLMQEYFEHSLGIRERNIVSAENVSNHQQYESVIRDLRNTVSVSDSLLTVYLSGYAEVKNSSIYLLSSNQAEEDPKLLNLKNLFEEINRFSLNSLVVFADLDFLGSGESQAAMNELAELINRKIPRSVIIYSSQVNQRSGMYTALDGEQKRHSIFTYFLAEALKEGNTTVRDIYNHLQRNVSFTSRRLYDQPQNVSIYGNPDITIAD